MNIVSTSLADSLNQGFTMNNIKSTSIAVNQILWTKSNSSPLDDELTYTPTKYLIPVPLKDTHYLLFNGLTGAIDVIASEDYKRLFCEVGGRLILGGTPREIGGGVLLCEADENLLSRGYFLSPEEELKIEEELNAKILADSEKEPMHFFFAPTNYCSVGCTYCIESENPKTAQRIALDPEKFSQLLKLWLH